MTPVGFWSLNTHVTKVSDSPYRSAEFWDKDSQDNGKQMEEAKINPPTKSDLGT